MGFARSHKVQSVIMASGGATSAAIDLRDATQGAFRGVTTFEPTTVKFQGSDGPTGTFEDIWDTTSAIITEANIAADKMHQLPSQCFSFPYIKIVGTVGGNVAADRTIIVFTNN